MEVRKEGGRVGLASTLPQHRSATGTSLAHDCLGTDLGSLTEVTFMQGGTVSQQCRQNTCHKIQGENTWESIFYFSIYPFSPCKGPHSWFTAGDFLCAPHALHSPVECVNNIQLQNMITMPFIRALHFFSVQGHKITSFPQKLLSLMSCEVISLPMRQSLPGRLSSVLMALVHLHITW